MAISKASSQKMTASQVTKKPLSDLMDAIKDASAKGTKKTDFKNFLAEPVAVKTVDLSPPKIQKKSDIPQKETVGSKPTPQKSEAPIAKDKVSESSKAAPTEQIVETDIDLDDCVSLDQKETVTNTVIPISAQVEIAQSLELKSEPSRFAHMKEQDIQEWINEGRVKIEVVAPQNQEFISQDVTASQQALALTSKITRQDTPQEIPTEIRDSFQQELTSAQIEAESSASQSTTPSRPTEVPQVIQQTQAPVAQPIVGQSELQPLQKATTQQTTADLKVSATSTSSIKGTKAATLTTLDKLNALNQIKEQLKQSLQKGETHLKIQLKPHEMGKVDIKLDISRDGLVTAAFKAENRETLETLTRHAVDFQNIFSDAGLQADSQGMNFSMSRENQSEKNTFGEALYTEDLPELEEVKVINSGFLPSSQINILT